MGLTHLSGAQVLLPTTSKADHKGVSIISEDDEKFSRKQEKHLRSSIGWDLCFEGVRDRKPKSRCCKPVEFQLPLGLIAHHSKRAGLVSRGSFLTLLLLFFIPVHL